MIDLRGEQLIEHIHRRGEEHTEVALAGLEREDLGDHRLAGAGIANQYNVGSSPHEVEIEQLQDARFGLLAALVIGELKRVDGLRRLQFRLLHLTFDGTLAAGFEFEINQPFERAGEAEVSVGGIIDRLLDPLADRGQAELIQLQRQWSWWCRHRLGCHCKVSFRGQVKVHRKQPTTAGRWRVD